MKRIISVNLGLFGCLILLGFLSGCQTGSYFSKDNDFRISDTAKVSRIEIFSEDTVVLTRIGSSWLVNHEIPANGIAITNFLFSFLRMEAKGMSDIAGIENQKAIRIKIFEGRRMQIVKCYQINDASFMIKEGSKKLYSVEVKGYPRIKPAEVINPNPDHWKEKMLLNLKASDIRQISLTYPSNPENNFQIKQTETKPILLDGNGIEITDTRVDREKMDYYLSYFTNVFYDSSSDSEIQESIDAKWILKVEDISGKNYELKIYPLLKDGKQDMFLGLVKYNNERELKLTRFMVLDLLLQDRGHFLLEQKAGKSLI